MIVFQSKMQAGEVGFQITWDPEAGQTGNIQSLLGANVSLQVSQPGSGYNPDPFTACSVSGDGLTAWYITQASTDFPTGGVYYIQWTATWSDGSTFESEIIQYNVGLTLPDLPFGVPQR
jgi:hypothetical protein